MIDISSKIAQICKRVERQFCILPRPEAQFGIVQVARRSLNVCLQSFAIDAIDGFVLTMHVHRQLLLVRVAYKVAFSTMFYVNNLTKVTLVWFVLCTS